MSNLIRYIIQEDPEKQMKKNDLDYTKYPTWAPIQKQSQEDKYKGYKFSSKNLLENSFNSLTSNKSSQSKDEGSFMGGIFNIFNNIKSDTKSSSNTSQSIAKTAAEESSKIGTVLSPKSIGNDNASYKVAQNIKGNITNDASPYKLGTLSGKAESNNGKKIFNDCDADKTGGCSYGTYQIATGPGTMKDYLTYMKNNKEYQKFYEYLQQAGGFEGAKLGTEDFKSTWEKLSQDTKFLDSQHNFILKNNYNQTINKLKYINGLNLDKRSPVVKDAIFSTSVQFGGNGGANLIHKALGDDVANLSDADIINKIYDERGYKKYFKSSSEGMQKNIKKNRSYDERQQALELLLKYPNKH